MLKIMTLPKLGVNMVEATIVNWLVSEGDSIEKEQPILEAETDKSSQEIPATVSGILVKMLVKSGDIVQCQQPIAVFVEKGEELPPDFSIPAFSPAAETTNNATSMVVEGSSEDSKVNQRVKISPLAKKIARELNIDFTQIPPVRPDGRIEKEDVLAFAAKLDPKNNSLPGVLPADPSNLQKKHRRTEVVALRGIRKIVADRMSESARTTARAVLSLKADAGKLIEWKQKLKTKDNPVSYNDQLVAITAKALQEFPELNSMLEEQNIKFLKEINIGVAVDTERGLIVPVIHHADEKDVLAISRDFQKKWKGLNQEKTQLRIFQAELSQSQISVCSVWNPSYQLSILPNVRYLQSEA